LKKNKVTANLTCFTEGFSPQAWGCTGADALAAGRQPFSPQAWGCTAQQRAWQSGAAVFPTGVGVYRLMAKKAATRQPFSPQAWGCTEPGENFSEAPGVFPTGVGVYRSQRPSAIWATRFPHRRGGVPQKIHRWRPPAMFSPQAWGCTVDPIWHIHNDAVFPTGVGVYRVDGAGNPALDKFSPQAWGCTG